MLQEFDFSRIQGLPCMSEEERLKQIKANLGATHKRITFKPFRHVLPFGVKPMVGKMRGMEGHNAVWDIPEPHERVAVLCCYGPSLNDGLEELSRLPHGDVATVSGAHDFLIGHDIVPRFHIECDPRPHKGMMITPHFWPSYLMASCVHPDLLEKLNGHDVWLWHITERVLELEPGALLIRGGGSVGIRAFPLLYAMGYRKFVVHGLDLSFGMQRHAGAHTGDVPAQIIEVECNGRTFNTTLSLMRYLDMFREHVAPHIGEGADKIRVELRGNGLLKEWTGF